MDLRETVQSMGREHEERAAQALAKKIGLSYINLVDYPFSEEVLHVLSRAEVDQLAVISYLRTGKKLKVASPHPTNPDLKSFLDEFSKNNGYEIELTVCSATSFNYAKKRYAISAAPSIRQSTHTETVSFKGFENKEQLAARLAKISATESLDVLFAGAIAMRATDIHLEPTEQGVVVRFRIDGVLQEITAANQEFYRSMRSRIKYLSEMKLDIVDQPQDGRFEHRTLDKKIDVRVSALPTPYGETFVLRLLTGGRFIALNELGFTPQQSKIIREAMKKPNGLILNTGPTGSGKTTTLYAILSELNKPGVKIITIEDPIEYRLEGVQQSQIEPEKGYDFATALKSTLRQDPDIIMVGEIRDSETAVTAVQAALTGHLVLSTLHTNSAAGAIPRLLDMGVKSYLLGGVINLIIAQRLVRKLEFPDKQGDERYKGRIAIAELLVPNHAIETLIQQKGSIDQYEAAAVEAGMQTLYEDGEDKVKAGITTQEELERVARESVD